MQPPPGIERVSLKRRFLFCAILTFVSALPSYLVALATFDLSVDARAVHLAIALFFVAAVLLSCLPVVERFLAFRETRLAFAWALLVRSLFTLLLPLSLAFEETLRHEFWYPLLAQLPGAVPPAGFGKTIDFSETLLIGILDGLANVLLFATCVLAMWPIFRARHRASSASGFPLTPAQGTTQDRSGAAHSTTPQ
jgi:hypothetical protein